MELEFYKIREDAKLPHRAHPTDAGMDLFYCPDLTQESVCIWRPNRSFRVPPGENCLVPTGLKVDLPPRYMLEIKNKSSIASKRQLIVGACVVDPGYTGEIFVNLINVGERETVVQSGAPLPVQLVVVPCRTEFKVISNLEFLEETNEHQRQVGSLGSSEQFVRLPVQDSATTDDRVND